MLLLSRLFLLSLLLITSCGYQVSVSAPWGKQGSGSIPFHKDSQTAMLDSALQQGKPVFMDFYTNWCGPCKILDREVLTNQRVVQKFSRKFINLKINAEQGDGPALAQKYSVKAYPTLILLDAKGQEQKRIVGICNASSLLRAAGAVHR
ncbi:MAG TPA: thioredoxin family protein [Saprospiraceae bacterium]|nr:thioredoxin family protein [Saprospiraceae bacterium]